jgi:ABC-type polysaccharide/polyol phosphate transport system ATPase subunit
MSSNIAIKVENLSKCYLIYNNPRDRLKQFVLPRVNSILGFTRKNYYKEFWALKNISFEVTKGETVGIIGRNGSGKSTLLQLICGTVSPNNGIIETNGRIAALLELGAGFNPDFSGRENVYINCAILGLSREETNNKYNDIVEFADIHDFMEQPVKTYSSGMYVRLAFSVAINVNPEILIIDEALSVGDMLFQAKCMLRLKQMIDSGVTVLFVSHDIATVKALCKRCVYIENGHMVSFGKAVDVVDLYISNTHLEINKMLKLNLVSVKKKIDILGQQPHQNIVKYSENNSLNNSILVSINNEVQFQNNSSRYGDGGGRILDVKLLDDGRNQIDKIEVGKNFLIQISIRFEKMFPTFAVGFSIRDLKGQMLVGDITTCHDIQLPQANPGDIYVFEISSTNRVRPGIYSISVGLEFPVNLNTQHLFIDVVENVVVFQSIFSPNPSTWFHSMVSVPADIRFLKI